MPGGEKPVSITCISHDLLKEEELDNAWEESREAKETIEDLSDEEIQDLPRRTSANPSKSSSAANSSPFSDKLPIPGDLLKNLKKEYLRRELWVPLEKKDGIIQIIVDDPNNILKRDMIENLLKTKSVRYDVSLPDDIIKFINHFYPVPRRRILHHRYPRQTRMRPTRNPQEEEEEVVTESDSVIMQLVNKIILDAQAKRASDIHVEPNVGKKNVEVRYRVDGDCALYQTLPYSYRAAVVSRIKIMSNLDITVRRLPQDGKIKFRKPGGEEIELRVATIPTQGGVEDVVMRILATAGDTLPLDRHGDVGAQFPGTSGTSWTSPTGWSSSSAPPAPARRPPCTPPSMRSTRRTGRSGRPRTPWKSPSTVSARSRSSRRSASTSPPPCAPSSGPTRT